MESQHTESILRISRSDSEGGHVLVNVSSDGSSALDLRLLATEGENPYIGTIKHSRIARLRDKRNQQIDSEWEAVLSKVLLKHRNSHTRSIKDHTEKLEVIAHIADENLTIKFRNNISGITQGLGEILLKQDENQEIDLIGWALTAVERLTAIETESQDLAAKYEEQSKTMEKLNKQLDDLIEAKKKHENAMLEKFRELLNAKKLKIRDQQRMLAGAKIDNKQAEKLQYARETAEPRTPAISRKGKRKIPASADTSSEDNAYEDTEPRPKLEDGSPGQQDSPEASANETTEDEGEDNISASQSQPSLPDRTDHVAADKMQLDTPPRRELPFGDQNAVQRNPRIETVRTKDRPGSHEELGTKNNNTDDKDNEDNDDDDDEL